MKKKALILFLPLFLFGLAFPHSVQAAKSKTTIKTVKVKVPKVHAIRVKKENNVSTKTDYQQKQAAQWQSLMGKRYYFVNGKKIIGLHKINGSWYLFDHNGAMMTGLRKIPHQKVYGYFNQAGQRQFKNSRTGKAYYWINSDGSVVGIRNYAKVICQRPQMPTGCEITAVTMMLDFAGKKVTKFQAAKIMPRSSNPNKGFIGSPYKKYPGGYWVAPDGVKSVVKHYLGTDEVMTGKSLTSIKHKLLYSRLVVAWVGMFDGFSNHAIALTGYHGNILYFNDPWTGTKRSIQIKYFEMHWRLDGQRALSY